VTQLTIPVAQADSPWLDRTDWKESATRASLWLQTFILLQIGCQVILLFETMAGLRVAIRTAAFGVSLAMLAFLPGRSSLHPAWKSALVIMGVLGLNLLHTAPSTALAGLAQVLLYVAILAPLFWVARLPVTPPVLRRILLLLWVFHTISAGFGVLQVTFPGRFQPSLSSAIVAQGQTYTDSLKITLANGEKVLRPMGLTDSPGGAAAAGLYAALFGLGFFINERGWLIRLASVGSMGIGLFCIYLSQVRSILVMVAICVVVFGAVLLHRGERQRLLALCLVVMAAVLGSFIWAVAVGGEAVSRRLATLVEDSPDRIYYHHRGKFLEWTITELLPEYPLGAGLGRWGMTNYYFADNNDPTNPPIWSEIQWTSWALDGGIPLILAYSTALILAMVIACRVALGRLPGYLPTWGSLVLAYDISAMAVTFNYPLFIGQGGLEFWLINATLFAAASRAWAWRRPRAKVVST
jgi:hypothetical protein